MSGVDSQEGKTVEDEGLVIEKSFDFDDFPVPAVVFVIRSHRDDPAVVRFTDPLPDGISVDDVGLHPNYGEEHLEIEGDHVAFERRIEPDEEFMAVYGLRDIDEEKLDGGLLAPEIETVDPVDGDTSAAIREVIEGEDGPEEDSEDASVEPLELDDPKAEAEIADDSTPQDDTERAMDSAEDGGDTGASDTVGETGRGPTGDLGEGDSLAAALVAELRSGNVETDVRSTLRQELSVRDDSTEVRIDRLQSDVADIQAYTDALEEFLDENGPADQLIEDLQDDLDAVTSDVQQTTAQVEDLSETVESVEDRLDGIAEDIQSLQDTVDDFEDERVDELKATVEEMSMDLAEVAEIQERLQSVFADPGDSATQTDDES